MYDAYFFRVPAEYPASNLAMRVLPVNETFLITMIMSDS